MPYGPRVWDSIDLEELGCSCIFSILFGMEKRRDSSRRVLVAPQIPRVMPTDKLSGWVPARVRRDESGTCGPGRMQLC